MRARTRRSTSSPDASRRRSSTCSACHTACSPPKARPTTSRGPRRRWTRGCSRWPSSSPREWCKRAGRITTRAFGSMGLASAIGLGLTLAQAERAAVVFDGDGNLLMNFGILAMVGGLRPRRLVHVVFDNGVYGSTGNQISPTPGVRLDRVAAAAGYGTVAAVTTAVETESAVRAALDADGPHFVLVKTTAEEADVPRIPYSPAEIRDRFRASL